MEITRHNSYLFVFAHPDDEVYACALMRRLHQVGKSVTAVFITSGDAGGQVAERERAVQTSMRSIGLAPADVHLLSVPEAALLQSFSQALAALSKVAADCKPDCIIGMDYEGGHEGHDSASFLAARAARSIQAKHYVYPAYHAKNGIREAACFLAGHQATDELELNAEETDLKIKVLEAHRDQVGHFLQLQRRDAGYFARLFNKEVFMDGQALDYRLPPAAEIGYESHRNGYSYTDFQTAVRSVL